VTRRQLLSLPVTAAILGRTAHAQPDFPGAAYHEYARVLPDYLRDVAASAYATRNHEIAKLASAEAIRARQQWVRETLWKLVGGMPQRTPLNVHTTGAFERAGYRVEKLIYESIPNFHIPANLYIPTTGHPPYPAVLFQMGHTSNGKAGDTYQRCCQGLARLGYLVLAFDPMGQGERIYYPDSSGIRSRLESADSEHTVPGKQMLLNGDTATRMQLWDAVRSLDVLASHPLADARRLASTGQSGGATVTMLLAAVDDRLAVAAVCSGNTENVACANFNPPGATDDAEQNLIGSGPLGFDRWDLMYPLAPKPLLISVSDMDFFHTYSPEYIRNGWEEFKKLRAIYATLGAADRLAWVDTPLPHGLAYDSRLQVYNWFARWLKGETAPVTQEPATEPEKDETLWASASGSMLRSFHGETPFTLNRARQVMVRPMPLGDLLGAERPPAGLKPGVLRRAVWRDVTVEALEVGSAPRVWLPGWLYLPAVPGAAKQTLLLLDAAGRDQRWQEGGLYHALAQRGYAVCAADVRGVGDLAPEIGRGAAAYARAHADDEDYAWASLIFGKPLLGQRVTDILALAAALRAHPALRGLRLKVAASKRLTAAALFAAAMDPAIGELYLAGGLLSFRNVVETERYSAPFGSFVFGILQHTDLPEAAAALAPRRVCLAGTVDATGVALEVSAVRALYGGEHIVIRPEAKWDVEAVV
jgi:dienelactone hydrolase